MIYSSLVFAAMAASVATAQATDQRNLATLAEKWNIPDEPTFAFDSNTFTLTFPVTNYINTGMADYSLWTAPDCQSDNGVNLGTDALWTAHSLVESDALQAANDFDKNSAGYTMEDSGVFADRAATISAEFNPQTISNSGIYSEQNINNQLSAEIRFCIRFGLWTTADLGVTTPVEVNFIETLITLTVDLTDGFEIGQINVEPKDRLVRTANQAYEVRGYECSLASTDALTEEQRVLPRNQGQIIHICVTPEDDAQADGIFMRSVDDFAFTRGTDIRQAAIVDGDESPNLLTSFNAAACVGSLVCRFSTLLFADFYATPGAVDGEGVASMQFGNTRRRALRSEEQRDLQGDGAGAAEFDLQFDVNQATARVSNSGAGSTSVAAAMSIAALAAAMM